MRNSVGLRFVSDGLDLPEGVCRDECVRGAPWRRVLYPESDPPTRANVRPAIFDLSPGPSVGGLTRWTPSEVGQSGAAVGQDGNH